ncbi:MAG: 50S ribosomal protein L32 [Patescibacteria group bacterium]
MNVPKKHRSHSRARTTKSQLVLTERILQKCSNCGQKTLSHKPCFGCGFYNGKKVLEIKEKKDKKSKKK